MSATSGNVHHCGPQLQSKQQVRWQDTGVAHEAGTDLGGPHRECMWQRSWLPPPSQSAFAQSHHWPRSTPVSVSHLLHVCCCGKDCCCMPALYPALAPTWYMAGDHSIFDLSCPEAYMSSEWDMQCINVGHNPNAKMQSNTAVYKIRCHNGMSTCRLSLRIDLLLQ